jgi:hypothetical protein
MPDGATCRKRQISGCRSRKPFDDIRLLSRLSDESSKPLAQASGRGIWVTLHECGGDSAMLSLEFLHAPIGASGLGTARLRLAFADNARGHLRSDCSTGWLIPCRRPAVLEQ